MSRAISRWLPAVLIMAVIFIFSSIPSAELPSFSVADLVIKKGGHMLGYGLLALSYLYGFWKRASPKTGGAEIERPLPIRLLILAWTLSVLYALTDEFHQSFVPGRNASLVDVGIDAFGAAGMLGLYNYWKYHSGREKQ